MPGLLEDAFQHLFGDTRGLPQPKDPLKLEFESEDEFYNDDPKRRFSPEADYGVGWQGLDGSMFPKWRVAYVGLTGEVYAQRSGADNSSKGKDIQVILLGKLPPDSDPLQVRVSSQDIYYKTLDKVLAGWPEKMQTSLGLAWVKEQLAQHNRHKDSAVLSLK